LGYFILSKNPNEPPKVGAQSGHPAAELKHFTAYSFSYPGSTKMFNKQPLSSTCFCSCQVFRLWNRVLLQNRTGMVACVNIALV